jgi:hypothetical protein
MNSKTKLIIAIVTLIVQLANLIFLSTTYPEVSIIISIVSFAVAFTFAFAVAFTFAFAFAVASAFVFAFTSAVAVAGAVAVAVVGAEYLNEVNK